MDHSNFSESLPTLTHAFLIQLASFLPHLITSACVGASQQPVWNCKLQARPQPTFPTLTALPIPCLPIVSPPSLVWKASTFPPHVPTGPNMRQPELTNGQEIINGSFSLCIYHLPTVQISSSNSSIGGKNIHNWWLLFGGHVHIDS